MNSATDSPCLQAPRRTYLRRSSSTIASFTTALSSLTPPTKDDISLRQLSPDVPKVTSPEPSLTPQLFSPPSETHNDAQDPVLHSFIMRASGLSADDVEYGPKTLDDFLRGDNAVQRTINFCRYVQMKKLPLSLSLIKNILVIALYSYTLIWFLDLRDTWRKLKLEDYDSRNHWFIFLTFFNGSLLIITVYKAIRNVSRLQGAPYEKHTFLDVGEAFDPFKPGKADVYQYFLLSAAAVTVHLTAAIRIALWVKEWMAGGSTTSNPSGDIVVGWLYFVLLMGHAINTLTCVTVHLRYGARWDKAPTRDPRSLTRRDEGDGHLLPLHELDGFHQACDNYRHGDSSTRDVDHDGYHPRDHHGPCFCSACEVPHPHEYRDVDIWEGIPRGRSRSYSVLEDSSSSDSSVGTMDTQMTIDIGVYAEWRWAGKLKIHLTNPSLYLL